MRRVLLAAVALTAACAVTACGPPPHTDKNLTNNWPALTRPSYTAPKIGDCRINPTFSAFDQPQRTAERAADCHTEHTFEVVATGDTTTAQWDSDQTRTAYEQCSAAIDRYVGGDWHTGRLLPYLSIPNARGTWVCGVAEAADDLFAPQPRTGTLQDGLKDNRLTCVDLEGGDVSPEGFYRSVSAVLPVACTEPHDTEFVGLWTAPPGAAPPAEAVSRACYAEVAAFLGLTEPQLYTRKDIYTFWDGLTAAQLTLGDRTAHCFLNVATTRTLRASLKGLGPSPLPG